VSSRHNAARHCARTVHLNPLGAVSRADATNPGSVSRQAAVIAAVPAECPSVTTQDTPKVQTLRATHSHTSRNGLLPLPGSTLRKNACTSVAPASSPAPRRPVTHHSDAHVGIHLGNGMTSAPTPLQGSLLHAVSATGTSLLYTLR
jgi:hypothetical protein